MSAFCFSLHRKIFPVACKNNVVIFKKKRSIIFSHILMVVSNLYPNMANNISCGHHLWELL